MEKSNPDNLETDLVIVANDSWPARIARLVRELLFRRNLRLGQILFCRSVYEAAATTIELHQQDRTVKACIMVDYLPDREMNVFVTLAKLSQVSSIAFSGCAQRKKLIRAQQLGADDLLTPFREANLKEPEAQATSYEVNGNTKVPKQSPETAPSSPTSTSPLSAEPDDDPILSREEIDALLQ